MQIQEAYRVLGITTDEEPEAIRRRFHLLLHACHPDAAGSSREVHEKARRLIEAYQLVKSVQKDTGAKRLRARRDIGIPENRNAFCERKIYMRDTLGDAQMIIDIGIRGKYYWDPDLEPFDLLMKSVNEAAGKLVKEDAAPQARIKVFHLLMQEFIDPYTCVRVLFPDPEEREEESTHIVPCRIKEERRGRLQEERYRTDNRYSVTESNNRLYLYVSRPGFPDQLQGQITFDRNDLYYVVTPLFVQKAVKAQYRCRNGRSELVLEVDHLKRRDVTASINLEIARTV